MFFFLFFLSFFPSVLLCNRPRKLEDEFKSGLQDSNTNWLHAGCLLKFMHFLNQTAETDWGQHLKVILFQMVPNVGWIAAPFDVFINQFEARSSAFFSPPAHRPPPRSPFSSWSYLNTRVVKSGRGEDNRCIGTKAANALKLSQIPQKSVPAM